MFQHRRSVPNIKFSCSVPSGIDMTSGERHTVDRVENSSESNEGLQHSLFSLKLKTSDNKSGEKIYVTVKLILNYMLLVSMRAQLIFSQNS